MTSKKRQGRLLPFAAGVGSGRRRSADEIDSSLAALLTHWRVSDSTSTLDARVMVSAQRLLAPRRRRRIWRAVALAAGLILTLALVDRTMLSAAERAVRESLAGVRRAVSSLLVLVGNPRAANIALPGRPGFALDTLVPLATPARPETPHRLVTVPRVDARTRVALEVRALSLLARGQMLAGTQIEVTPTDAGIAIHGVTDTPDERAAVLTALGGFVQSPGVTVEVHPATELSRTRPRHAATPRMRVVEIAPDERDVGPERRAMMNRALTTSREALVHALSLRQLTTRFSAEARRDMSAATQYEWRSLVRSMAQVVRQHAHDLRTQLQPLLSSAGDDADGRSVVDVPPLKASDDEVMRVAHEIVAKVMTVDEQIRGAFARSTRPTTLNGALVGRALDQLEALATAAAAR